jgi:hypothetical protein
MKVRTGIRAGSNNAGGLSKGTTKDGKEKGLSK